MTAVVSVRACMRCGVPWPAKAYDGEHVTKCWRDGKWGNHRWVMVRAAHRAEGES